MDNNRAFLAVVLSLAILLGYQYFIGGFSSPTPDQPESGRETSVSQPAEPAKAPVMSQGKPAASAPAASARQGKDVVVSTDLYIATLTENGGALKKLQLKEYKEATTKDASGKELAETPEGQGSTLKFSWGTLVAQDLVYDCANQKIDFSNANGPQSITCSADAGNGLFVERKYSFEKSSYIISLATTIRNISGAPLQGTAQLHQLNGPFEPGGGPTDKFLFRGPALFVNNELKEIKDDKFAQGPVTETGKIDWAGYAGNYFLRAILPVGDSGGSFTMQGNASLTETVLSGNLDTLAPEGEKTYEYRIFYGPKKIDELKKIGTNLEKAVNFGWFDVLARPTLWLLNFFYGYVKNYGVAIILVTVLFKLFFWPIASKGMKSMKNMQKLQPKMAKLKEKYKDDPTRMNQEMMNLYKTYKVNPLGGCLPMFLQIPVFFALYKVLLQSIELRHAPFMLWITDLSAPDRLWLGFDLPYLGGLPVLTLLMGASMFVQQKLTPTSADPAQAKIMMFLPVVFTFMFLNFASGLVLYWFVNNLLSILQQQMINYESQKKAQTYSEAK